MIDPGTASEKQTGVSRVYYGILIGGTVGFFWIWIFLFLGWLFSKLSGQNIHSLAINIAIGGGVGLLVLLLARELKYGQKNI